MSSILKPGRNCWKICEDVKVSFLIDAEDYFRDLHQTIRDASRTIYIPGWDIDSRTELIRRGKKPRHNRLGPLLDHLVRENNELTAYILDWDFSTILLPQREIFPSIKFRWEYHDRIRFELDGRHPVGSIPSPENRGGGRFHSLLRGDRHHGLSLGYPPAPQG